jgi:hypothetical protein
MSETEIVTYVKYLSPGSFVANEDVRGVTSRDPASAARNAPESAFGFTFHERVIIRTEVAGEVVTTRRAERNPSPVHYIDGEVMTAEQVACLPERHDILLSNMRGNHWDRVVRARGGWFQPFSEDDVIVSAA